MSGKGDRGRLGVVTVAVNVSRVKCEDPLGTVAPARHCAGGEGPDPGAAEGGQGCPMRPCSWGHVGLAPSRTHSPAVSGHPAPLFLQGLGVPQPLQPGSGLSPPN